MSPRIHQLPLPNAGGTGTHHITVRDWGDAHSSRTAFCVHGLTRNARDFDTLAQALAREGYRVLAPSMAGRGESPWLADPAGYTYPAYVADCIALLDNFHLRQVDWIGTSMGGIIGMMLAAQSGRIRRLVLNDIGIHLSAEALGRIYAYVNAMPPHFAGEAEAEAYLAQAFAPFGIAGTAHWPKFVADSLDRAADGTLRSRAFMERMAAMVSARSTSDCVPCSTRQGRWICCHRALKSTASILRKSSVRARSGSRMRVSHA